MKKKHDCTLIRRNIYRDITFYKKFNTETEAKEFVDKNFDPPNNREWEVTINGDLILFYGTTNLHIFILSKDID